MPRVYIYIFINNISTETVVSFSNSSILQWEVRSFCFLRVEERLMNLVSKILHELYKLLFAQNYAFKVCVPSEFLTRKNESRSIKATVFSVFFSRRHHQMYVPNGIIISNPRSPIWVSYQNQSIWTGISSILIGFSIINHPFWGTIIFGNTHI